jgi:DNA-binding IclR family transcriptional regulator
MDSLGQADPGRNRISTGEPDGRGAAVNSGGEADGERETRDEGSRRSEGRMGRRAGDSGVGVLDRSMALLDLLTEGPRSLRSLAEASGLPRPTAHRLLVALESHGLVGRGADGTFRLGPKLTELALRAGPGLGLGALASGVLARLHEQTGESVQLYLRSGDRRLCVAARDAGAGLRDSVPVGALLPLDAGSGGKVLLAWSDDAERFPAVPATELAIVRRRGWASSIAEREPGLASVSVPVLRGGALLGALCVSGPASRLGSSPGRRLAPLLVTAARELAALAGAESASPKG